MHEMDPRREEYRDDAPSPFARVLGFLVVVACALIALAVIKGSGAGVRAGGARL
jgi:hypothetical protein